MKHQSYGLIHLINGGEFTKPLVASQVFDSAQAQAESPGADAPQAVAAMSLGAMRFVFDRKHRQTLTALKRRCPEISIHLIGGVSRWRDWPASQQAMWLRRRLFPHVPVVYHCRGEDVAVWAGLFREKCSGDAVVLDVRGLWHEELLEARGLAQADLAQGRDRQDYDAALSLLRLRAGQADAVTTVSQPLRHWLEQETAAPRPVYVIPCCVKNLTHDEARAVTRARWGVKDYEKVLLYSGTVLPYQHLGDVGLPFMKGFLEAAPDTRVVLLTPQLEPMKQLAQRVGLATERTIIESLPQNQVAAALTGADAGLLLRRNTLVNHVAHPTKFSEFLAAGLPVILETGLLTGFADIAQCGAGLRVTTVGRPPAEVNVEVRRVLDWLRQQGTQARAAARALALSSLTWHNFVPLARTMYQEALQRRSAKSLK